MIEYVLLLMDVFCNNYNHCVGTRAAEMQETAIAIAAVARNRLEARWLVVVSFAETGFRTRSYMNNRRKIVVVPFGAMSYIRHHNNFTVEDLARAALSSIILGRNCGARFSQRMIMFISGNCQTTTPDIMHECNRRERLLNRLRNVRVP